MSNPVNITITLEKELCISVPASQEIEIRETEQLLKYFIHLPPNARQRYLYMMSGSFMVAHLSQESNENIY